MIGPILSAFAEQIPLPKTPFKVAKKTTNKTINVMTTYLFDEMEYVQPLIVNASLVVESNTPEATLRQQFEAMRQGNIESFLATWDKHSAAEILQINNTRKISNEAVKVMWSQTLANRKVVLTRRVDYQNYVILEYRLREISNEQDMFTDAIVFTYESGKWLATRQLRDDPVVVNWRAQTTQNLVDIKGRIKQQYQAR